MTKEDKRFNREVSRERILNEHVIDALNWNSWILASLAVLLLVAAIYPMTRIKKRLKGLVDESIFNGTNLIISYNEAFNGNRIVASYNLQEHRIARMEDTLKGVFRVGIKMVQRTRTLGLLTHLIIAVGIASTVWLQGYLISIGHL